MSHVTSHMSHIPCHMSHVTRHLPPVTNADSHTPSPADSPPCFFLQKTDGGAPISGDPPTCTFKLRSDESENNMDHCGSSAGSSACQALDAGALCLLRRVEHVRRVEHSGSPEIKMCFGWCLQRVLSALRNKQV